MVEEYYTLRQREIKKEMQISKQDIIIKQQERIIQEHTCFMHDSLDQIFQQALEKGPKVMNMMRQLGHTCTTDLKKDAFKLYQGYMEIVQPIEIQDSMINYVT